MDLQQRTDFVDLVAQAVVDKIEERDRINGMVNMVVSRVIAMQKEEAELQAQEAQLPEAQLPEAQLPEAQAAEEQAGGVLIPATGETA